MSGVARGLAAALLALGLAGCSAGAAPAARGPAPATPAPLPSFAATDLTKIRDDVAARTAELRQEGADVASVNVDPAARVVEVMVRNDVARATTALHRRYPPAALRVVGGTVGH